MLKLYLDGLGGLGDLGVRSAGVAAAKLLDLGEEEAALLGERRSAGDAAPPCSPVLSGVPGPLPSPATCSSLSLPAETKNTISV